MVGGFGGPRIEPSRPRGPRGPDATTLTRIQELERNYARMRLANQALWELVREKLSLADGDLEAKMGEIDARDGREDGRLTDTGLRCPQCGRVSSSKHAKCMYCGLEFERSSMF